MTSVFRPNRRQFIGACAATFLAPDLLLAAEASRLDTAYVNGRIWTGVPGAPLASALGVAGSRIAAIDAGPVKRLTDKRTRVVDLDGAFVIPGFIDNHTHFLNGAATLVPPDLRNVKTREEFARRVGEAARQLPAGEWVQGGNWDAELWGGELPTREWIDAVTPNTPVAVTRLDLHMWLLNSVALKLAGIDRNTPDPEGGRIVRDAKGEPTGIVIDKAQDLVTRVMPPLTDAKRERMMRDAIAYGLRYGVTQAHLMGLDWEMHETVVSLRAKGETGMRFYSLVPLKDWERLLEIVRREGRGDDWVRWGGLKVMVDGSLGSRTALFHAPYDDAPNTRGLIVTPEKDLREWMFQADKHGLHIAVHAIGDEANDLALDLMAEVERINGPRDRRFRIEHAQHLSPQAIPRFAAQNVVPSVQPYHAIDDGRWAINRIGAQRLKGTYAFKSLLDAGARVSFGSDWPVAPINPLTGIAAAVLRQTIDGKNPDGWMPQERVSVEQALTAYTITNAYVGFQDDRLGRLVAGNLADFVVLDSDLLSMDPQKITDARVLRTVVDGKERFTAS
ncbi:MAG TPA: amidohydrolase family protein [Steroidobacter sp.]